MDPITVTYVLATAAFAVGLGIFARFYVTLDDPGQRRSLAALGVIPGFAGLSYAAMALGVGTVTVDGTTLVGFRYIDWLVTTPLLVGYVGYVAGADRRSIAAVMLADALMIAAGAGAVATSGTLKWVLFGVSSLFHVSLFAMLYVVFPRTVPDNPLQYGLFSLLQNHIALLWLAYPFVWLMGPAGLGYAGFVGTSLTYAFLDVLAKLPYVYFFYTRRGVFTEAVTTDMGGDDATSPATAD
jgi:sensory rhodopsin